MSFPRDFRDLKKTRDGPTTDVRTDGPTDRPSYKDARTPLKREAVWFDQYGVFQLVGEWILLPMLTQKRKRRRCGSENCVDAEA